MECNREQNLARCACTNEDCARRGRCCECLSAHLSKRSFPACVFPAGLSGDRSFDTFARLVAAGQM